MAADLANLTIGSAEVMSGCAEDLLPLLPGRAYDAILSSPPYFNTEEYESSTQQSCHRYASYTDWREGFLRPVVEQGWPPATARGVLSPQCERPDRPPHRDGRRSDLPAFVPSLLRAQAHAAGPAPSPSQQLMRLSLGADPRYAARHRP